MDAGGPIREERRLVTALFADVAGSTALGERLDPEDVVEIVGRAVSLMCEAVEELGGSVKDLAGDGVLALFGAPIAHEDDPDRAVRAGLEIQRRLQGHAEQVATAHGIEGLGARVGIETGVVVMGPVGGGGRVEYGATGDALNTAARLQAHAPVGGIIVGPETRRQARSPIRWGETLPLELKGKRDVVVATLVLGIDDATAVGDGAGTVVGRDAELARLDEALDRLAAGAGGFVAIAGEAGIGKTRLHDELRRRASGRGVRWIEGRCSEPAQGSPFGGIRDLLRPWDGGRDAELVEVLERHWAPAAAADALSHLRFLLGIDQPSLAGRSPDAIRFGTLEALAALMTGMAAAGPVAIALEELHWSDPSTLDAVRRLWRLGTTAPVLVVGTLRPDPDAGSAALASDAGVDPSATLVRLAPLRAEDERTLLRQLAGRTLAPEDEDRILSAAEGIPLYLREFARSLDDAVASQISTLPALDRLILARLDRLEPALRDAATALAVLGREIDPVLAAALLPGEDREAVLAGLVRRGVLESREGDLAFAHALIRDVAYGTLVRGRRRALHRLAAEAMSAPGAAPDLATLAHHWEGADEAGPAAEAHLRAADEAERVSAMPEARDHVSAAWRLRGDDSPGAAALQLRRARLSSRTGLMAQARLDAESVLETARVDGDRALQRDALEELGFILAGAIDYAAATPLFEEALSLAETLGDRSGQVRGHAKLSIAWTNRLRFDLGLEHADAARTIAEGAGDPALLPVALDAMKQVELQVGLFDDARDHNRQLLRAAEASGDLWTVQACHVELGYVDGAQARWDDAERDLEAGWSVNRTIGDEGNRPLHLGVASWIARQRGAYLDALTLARSALEVALRHDHAEWTAWSCRHLGWVLGDAGDREGEIAALEQGLDAARRASADVHAVPISGRLAAARLAIGDRAGAGAALEECGNRLTRMVLPAGRTFAFGWDALVSCALVASELGEPGSSLADLREWVGSWAGDRIPEAEAFGSLALARLEEAVGSPADALVAVRRALEVATTAALPGAAWRARAALVRLEPDRAEEHRAQARSIVADLAGGLKGESIAVTLPQELDAALENS